MTRAQEQRQRRSTRALQRYQPYYVIVSCKRCGHNIGWIYALRRARVSILSIVQEHEAMTGHRP